MATRVIIFLCTYAVAVLTQSVYFQPSGYYWREFSNGQIPSDAVAGGRDRAGNPTYIGQVYGLDLELLPATIIRGSPNATSTRHVSAIQTDKNIKILCSNEQHKFRWIPTTVGETYKLANCHLVNGGSEVNYFLHIGRVYYQSEVIIGKVNTDRPQAQGLAIPYNGLPVIFVSYQILAFDCQGL
ncbi:hypothetical protein PPYR_07641 [Photinus pyralis]|uniref:Uncharacterized protein n=1 Tax=Photinus pyralis TaxID=7054 RepID=A0A5N4AEU9_PHOPY|nr:uncharacterized protein LOC116169922 [Photinus pyralis]XP_031349132.1 uncharacterized protein LOC116175157 [Photinus pyralis]KAB0795852.1 hypothetical protein PPYR_09913 [Photinus pyralis]KAB0799761.1 hypothetical protein PPYR_07641 [Photinus pyralis]